MAQFHISTLKRPKWVCQAKESQLMEDRLNILGYSDWEQSIECLYFYRKGYPDPYSVSREEKN